jgi:putative addiction module component (TIGR02574 family)
MTYPTSEDIFNLSPLERLTLIGDLWDSLDGHDMPVSPAQMDELVVRTSHLDQDKMNLVEWDSIKASIDARRTDA